MIDRKHIGLTMPAFSVPVEQSRLRFFAKATGGDPESRAVPPTYFFCLESESPHSTVMRETLGLDYKRLLHGEQGFTYHAMAYAGDTLTFEQRIEDIYDKKNGALEFVVRKTRVTNQRQELVAELRCVSVMRNG
ncbi:MaoC family dehydratase N-terminal domain-containing protein [Ramlibacter albus]|uniref:MaoC family dehydratase N-terminal domain-containing protein n=1 Tax=Ramlibacter albus TaxID=2079448 RepID=A0A923S2S5_9BURK|nr:MaoC family dehydratase N-terminal domain-containing protein [Ramlibacter albus]MBC5765784.1 MaoC family dehydratase N-terminal domain-containing protein [Ramlibacter albus]